MANFARARRGRWKGGQDRKARDLADVGASVPRKPKRKRRGKPRRPRPEKPRAGRSPIPSDPLPAANRWADKAGRRGHLAWGTFAGEPIRRLSGESLRGAIWAAERGKGGPAYLEDLRAELARRQPVLTAAGG